MKNILIAGAGTIGNSIAHWLADSKDYRVYVVDLLPQTPHLDDPSSLSRHQLDITDKQAACDFIQAHHITAIASSLPYYCNITVANIAQSQHLHYFDLTEDINVTATVEKLSEQSDQAYALQCGLAPGFINIVAHTLIQEFDQLDAVKLRCGALPQHSAHSLNYSFTWSPDGLINEYINPCEAIINHAPCQVPALEGLEHIQIDGLEYEAFNTSDGLGSLAQTYENQVSDITYKTIRYPGHAEKMRFLLSDLKLNQQPEVLKDILINSLPETDEDTVIVYVEVSGTIKDKFVKKTFVKKYHPTVVANRLYTAIQLTTTAGTCSIIDIVLNNPGEYHGHIKQERFTLDQLHANQYGQYFFPKQMQNKEFDLSAYLIKNAYKSSLS